MSTGGYPCFWVIIHPLSQGPRLAGSPRQVRVKRGSKKGVFGSFWVTFSLIFDVIFALIFDHYEIENHSKKTLIFHLGTLREFDTSIFDPFFTLKTLRRSFAESGSIFYLGNLREFDFRILYSAFSTIFCVTISCTNISRVWFFSLFHVKKRYTLIFQGVPLFLPPPFLGH